MNIEFSKKGFKVIVLYTLADKPTLEKVVDFLDNHTHFQLTLIKNGIRVEPLKNLVWKNKWISIYDVHKNIFFAISNGEEIEIRY